MIRIPETTLRPFHMIRRVLNLTWHRFAAICRESLVILASLYATAQAEQGLSIPSRSTRPEQRIAIMIDCSGSVEGNLLALEKAAVGCALTLVDGTVWIGHFNDEATLSSAIRIRSDADRESALGLVDSLPARGSTDLVKALGKLAALPAGTPCIVVTDGIPTNKPEEVLDACRQVPGPIYVISVNPTSEPDDLLRRMVAVNGGHLVKVVESQRLVESIVAITAGLTHYRSHTPAQTRLNFAGVRGKMIVIGLNVEPEIEPLPGKRLFRYHARMPIEDILLARANYASATDIGIFHGQILGRDPRIIRILLQGLSRADIQTAGRTVVDGTLRITTEFYDDADQIIDPTSVPGLAAEFQLRDMEGRILARSSGQHRGKSYSANVKLPSSPGTFELVVRTKDSRLKVPFDDEYKRFIRVIRPRYAGLDEQHNSVTRYLGKATSGSRSFRCSPVTIHSLDAPGPKWQVRIEPLAGPGGIIELEADRSFIEPTRANSASITLVASIGRVQPGDYQGAILLVPPVEEGLELTRIPVTLEVIEPIELHAVDVGEIEPGQSIDFEVPLVIRGDESWRLQVTGSRIVAGAGVAIVKVPETVQVRGADGHIRARLSTSPNAAEGDYEANIGVTREGEPKHNVPVRFAIVPLPSPLTCRPEKVDLTAPVGQIRKFQVRLENRQHVAVELLPASAEFQSATGEAAGGIVVLLRERLVLQPKASLTVTGQALPPIQPGNYSAILPLSTLTGEQTVLTVDVTVL